MSEMFANVQPAVRKETKKVAIGTLVCVVLMWAVFGIGHLVNPSQIPFDYTAVSYTHLDKSVPCCVS